MNDIYPVSTRPITRPVVWTGPSTENAASETSIILEIIDGNE